MEGETGRGRMRVTPRSLRIRISHQISNRRFTAARFRKPGPEGVTQVVPMQVFNLQVQAGRWD